MIQRILPQDEVDSTLYIVNYPHYQEELCKMEIKYLLQNELEQKYVFSSVNINPSRSPYIKECIRIAKEGESLEDIIAYVRDRNIQLEDFKVIFIKVDEDIAYEDRMNSIREIGKNIIGEANIKYPKIILGISKVKGKWFFGMYEKNDFQWHIHERKPCNYSNAITMRIARALANIAIENNLNNSIVDPCCGVGTVIIEALSMNANIKGYEINPLIAINAKKNLEFFSMDSDLITCGNMHEIKEKFDVAIIDLPYGLFTKTTLKEQTDIIKTARKICRKLILVTMEDMRLYIKDADFEVIDMATITKGKFIRYINLCK